MLTESSVHITVHIGIYLPKLKDGFVFDIIEISLAPQANDNYRLTVLAIFGGQGWHGQTHKEKTPDSSSRHLNDH